MMRPDWACRAIKRQVFFRFGFDWMSAIFFAQIQTREIQIQQLITKPDWAWTWRAIKRQRFLSKAVHWNREERAFVMHKYQSHWFSYWGKICWGCFSSEICAIVTLLPQSRYYGAFLSWLSTDIAVLFFDPLWRQFLDFGAVASV